MGNRGKTLSANKKKPRQGTGPCQVIVGTKQKQKRKVVFVRHRHKKDLLAIFSTRIALEAKEIGRIDREMGHKSIFQNEGSPILILKKKSNCETINYGITCYSTKAMACHIFLADEFIKKSSGLKIGSDMYSAS